MIFSKILGMSTREHFQRIDDTKSGLSSLFFAALSIPLQLDAGESKEPWRDIGKISPLRL
jgi:hypothetical protein